MKIELTETNSYFPLPTLYTQILYRKPIRLNTIHVQKKKKCTFIKLSLRISIVLLEKTFKE